VLTEPGGQLASIDSTGGQIQHDALLIVQASIEVQAVQHQKRLHGGRPGALIAVDERMVSDQREIEGGCLFDQRWMEIDAGKRQLGLSDRGFQRRQVPNSPGTPARFEKSPMKLNDLRKRKIAHLARRRYNSSFFFKTRSAAALKSSPAVASRLAIAARARSSGVNPRRAASSRSRSP